MRKYFTTSLVILGILIGCQEKETPGTENSARPMSTEKKKVIYQVFTRLFGNTNTTNKPWGTLEENGVGKFADFTDKALKEIRDMGVTHIWYTGVPHHAVVTDYSEYDLPGDDPDVIKGRAGSPYAVKDYYNVNPDLATDPDNRLQEFVDLINRTHDAGMKVMIDIVPNHVARNYEGRSTPEGQVPFGKNDDTSVAYKRDNNYYYIPGEAFKVPDWGDGDKPLGGEAHPLADGQFDEDPAKWTGNGSRNAQPDRNDWYETVKINYGVKPDGSFDFEKLPEEYADLGFKKHFEFWEGKDVPDSWQKVRDIALYWLDLGVDGFRYDMAEMVPVEFWSYLNSSIKMINPDAVLLAEVYQPALYRPYIYQGKMDYLYDKVEFYDSLKQVMRGKNPAGNIPMVQEKLQDIEHHMLHFLENHDEQRIASPEFAGDARKGKPAMVVSATISTSPIMIYFGQEVGEPGAENAGYGKPSRTSIFDYIGVPHHQRWVNNHQFDGGQLSEEEKDLRKFYKSLLKFVSESPALMGAYKEIHNYNKEHTEGYDSKLLSFLRWDDSEQLVIISNFSPEKTYNLELKVPGSDLENWGLKEGDYQLTDMLTGDSKRQMQVSGEFGKIPMELKPLESLILKIDK